MHIFRSVVCLSVICLIRAPGLNRSTDLDAIWQVHLWGPMTHCVRWGQTARFGRRTSSQLLMPPGEYKRGFGIPLFAILLWFLLSLLYVVHSLVK